MYVRQRHRQVSQTWQRSRRVTQRPPPPMEAHPPCASVPAALPSREDPENVDGDHAACEQMRVSSGVDA